MLTAKLGYDASIIENIVHYLVLHKTEVNPDDFIIEGKHPGYCTVRAHARPMMFLIGELAERDMPEMNSVTWQPDADYMREKLAAKK